VIVHVTDKNDTPPRFSGAPYALRLSEDAPTGATVLTIRADDPDLQGSISFEIVSDANEGGNDTRCNGGGNEYRLFQMDPIRGHVVLAEPLDREVCAEHRFTVRVSDGVQSAYAPVVLSVQDTNDNPPVFSSSVVSFDVAEDTARGARVGALRASDADAGANGQVSFSLLSDWGNELFALNPHTGEFTLTAGLDYEQLPNGVFLPIGLAYLIAILQNTITSVGQSGYRIRQVAPRQDLMASLANYEKMAAAAAAVFGIWLWSVHSTSFHCEHVPHEDAGKCD
ncbi:cadherin-related tumor suppressor-like, partial [Tropilaelaps mercedesae]